MTEPLYTIVVRSPPACPKEREKEGGVRPSGSARSTGEGACGYMILDDAPQNCLEFALPYATSTTVSLIAMLPARSVKQTYPLLDIIFPQIEAWMVRTAHAPGYSMDQLEDYDYSLRHYGEHLEPGGSPWTARLWQGQGTEILHGSNRDVIEAVESATKPIRERLLHPQMASLFCHATYEGIWALRLAGEPNKNFVLILAKYKYSRTPQSPENRVETTVTTSRTLFPCRLSETICDIWTRVLYATRYPRGRRIGMNDGVMYHFAYRSEYTCSMTGFTHSPPITTAPGKLATLAKALKAYVEAETDGDAQQLVFRDIKAQVAAFPAEVE